MRPKNLKRTSPGNLPTPNFSSQGSNAENIIRPKKIAITQRIIVILSIFLVLINDRYQLTDLTICLLTD